MLWYENPPNAFREKRGEKRDKEPAAAMDEATPANGATGFAGAAADAAAAAESEVEALEATPFDRAAIGLKKRLEAKLCADKEAERGYFRIRTRRRNASEPTRTSGSTPRRTFRRNPNVTRSATCTCLSVVSCVLLAGESLLPCAPRAGVME